MKFAIERWKCLARSALVALCLTGLGLAPGARAGDSAEALPPDAQAAHASFEAFAASWLSGLASDARTDRERRRLLLQASDGAPGHSYRTIGSDYDIRLKETGRASTPYVGILRYVEHRYECSRASTEDCRRVESSEMTELFPFKDGDWRY